ncbi:MAG TPA: ACP S-malonyltransferase [Gammaproteobacteria bacterium]|nr:ACP S-malonyltransferase [Gammaproteobacteria bacterium]
MTFAAVFPGQGSQSVGMLAALGQRHSEIGATFAEASELLGYDLARLVAEGPVEELNRTAITQPALLAAGIGVWRSWLAEGGPQPAVLAGHSLGEYAALVAADAISFASGLRLVRLRGEAMQDAVAEGAGAMAAILGLDAARLHDLCAEAASIGVVTPANFNSPEQTVIAGERAAVERAGELAAKAGAKRVIGLAVSVPSHCALMEPAAKALGAALAEVEIRPPRIPVLNNVDVAAPASAEAIADALVRQLTQPVRWTEIVRACRDNYGIVALAEFGPGKVLSGLARRIDRSLAALPLGEPAEFEVALQQLTAAA